MELDDPPCGSPGQPLEVKTYSGSGRGSINLVSATLASDNSVYAQLTSDLGPDKVKETARMMGIKSKLNGFCAESLGGLEDGVSPLEMASAYATIANGGYRNRPRMIKKIVGPKGKTLKLPKRWRVHRVKAFSDGVTYEATKILAAEHPGRHGHARQHRLPRRRQDRHDRQEHRRLVRRLHAAAVDRRLGRLPRLGRGLDERHVRARPAATSTAAPTRPTSGAST